MEKIIKEELEKIEEEIDKLENILEQKDKIWDNKRSWDDYCENRKPESKKISKLERRKRIIMPYKLSEKSNFGDEMTLEQFIDNVKCGGFIDYDGFGIYLKDGMETDIEIYPSDVKHKSIRKEFDKVIWFNR